MEDNKDFDTREDIDTGNEQDKRTFTQEEVDEIVRKRLARERQKQEKGGDNTDFSEREQAIAARELKCMAREKLFDAGMPASLADVLNYSDEKTLEAAIEEIKKLNPSAPKAWGQRMGAAAHKDPIRAAMGLDYQK